MNRRQKRLFSLIVGLLVLGVTFANQQFGWFSEPPKQVQQHNPGFYSVHHFVDGDTIAVNMNGKIETIRMIGVDTPETHKPNSPVQCYGAAAAAYVKNIVGTQSVRLEADEKSTNRDRYDRLLRYVYLPDGRLIEEEVIKNGYGFAYTQFPFTKSTEFVAAEQSAEQGNKGLWGNCTVTTESNGRKQTNNLP